MTHEQVNNFVKIYNHMCDVMGDMGDLSRKLWVKWPKDENLRKNLVWLDRTMRKNSYVCRFDTANFELTSMICDGMGYHTKKDTGTTKSRIEVYFNPAEKPMSRILTDITTLIKLCEALRE